MGNYNSAIPLIKMIFVMSVFCSWLSNPAMAQPEEDWEYPEYQESEIRTFSRKNIHHGYFWGMEARIGAINDNDNIILLAGGKAAWVVNRSISIGFSGYGLLSDYAGSGFGSDDVFLYGGYGGLFLEPILGPRFPVHLTFPTLLGAGTIELEDEQFFYDIEAFLVAEPGIAIEVNLTPYLRMGFTGRYRFTTGIGFDILDNQLLNGWSGGVTVKFGRF